MLDKLAGEDGSLVLRPAGPVSFEGDKQVEDSVLLELEVERCLDRSHIARLLNYLRATDIEVGSC